MIRSNYDYPFRLEAPIHNPWDGARSVELWLETSSPLEERVADVLQDNVFPFWLLGSSGALAGDAFAPWNSTCAQPAFSCTGVTARFSFAPSSMDERATLCLANLLWSAHDVAPIRRAVVHAAGFPSAVVPVDPALDDPYPPRAPHVPFPFVIEDSESDVRVLRVTWASEPSATQQESIVNELLSFGAAVSVGAFGVAPIPPSECGCEPSPTMDWDGASLEWVLDRCRFHWAALHALVSVCAALSARVTPVAELTIE